MREIKFRAWYKGDTYRAPEMLHDIQDVHDGVGIELDCFGQFLDNDDFAVMQCTGLQDRNGTEVYEGDIVNCSRGCPHVMEWHIEVPCLGLGGMPGFYLKGLNEGYVWTAKEEVIGNIHEHPELVGEPT